jgi:hypothetical protein
MFAPGLREGILDGIVINGVPATDFSYIRPIMPDEEESEPEYGADAKKKEQKVRPPGAMFKKDPANFYDPTINVFKK